MGLLRRAFKEGTVSFSDLSVKAAGGDYRLLFSLLSPSVGRPIEALSEPFSVHAAAAAALQFVLQPPADVAAGSKFQVSIHLEDMHGNLVQQPHTIRLTARKETAETAAETEAGAAAVGFLTAAATAAEAAAAAAAETETKAGVAIFSDLALPASKDPIYLKGPPSGGPPPLTVSPTTLVFNEGETGVSKTLQIRALDDSVVRYSPGVSDLPSRLLLQHYRMHLAAASEDPLWGPTAVEWLSDSFIEVRVLENDKIKLKFDKLDTQPVLLRRGDEISYEVSLFFSPFEVPIHLSLEAPVGVLVDPPFISFDGDNWNVPQLVRVEVTDLFPAAPLVAAEGLPAGQAASKLVITHRLEGKLGVLTLQEEENLFFWVEEEGKGKVVWKDLPGAVLAGSPFAVSFQLSLQPLETVTVVLRCGPLLETISSSSSSSSSSSIILTPLQWQRGATFRLRAKDDKDTTQPSRVETCEVYMHSGDSRFVSSIKETKETAEEDEGSSVSFVVLPGTSACMQCVEGHFCPDGATRPEPCPAGSTASAGAATCRLCAEGCRCMTPADGDCALREAGSCPPGRYPREGRCPPCPEGSFCPGGGPRPGGPQRCPSGTYSPAGSAACMQCPPGSFCPSPKLSDLQACPPGTYSDAGSTACSPCPAGFRCFSSAESSPLTPCGPGEYSEEGESSCLPCPKNHACPTPLEKVPCERPMQFAPVGQQMCKPCPREYQCEGEDPKACEPGFSSREGDGVCSKAKKEANTILDLQIEENTAPRADSTCPAGTYNQGTGCFFYHPFGYCGPGKCFECTKGKVCPPGIKEPLPLDAGYFSMESQLMSASEATLCPRGTYCPEGSTKPQYCATDQICQGGSAPPLTCPPGTIRAVPSTDATNDPSVCATCPIGYYCPSSTEPAKPCPLGTYSKTDGAISIDSCIVFPPGYLPVQEAEVLPIRRRVATAPLTYCTGAARGTTVLQAPKEARKGLVMLGHIPVFQGWQMLASALVACPATTARKDIIQCLPCPAGKYCPTGCYIPGTCPEGTYSDGHGTKSPGPGTHPSMCRRCPTGYSCGSYCPLDVTTYDMLSIYRCRAGMLCDEEGWSDLSLSKPCPEGYYCPTGAAAAIPCPGGTYNPLQRRTSVSDCMISKAGTYAEEATVSADGTGVCEPGYFCPPGSSSPRQVACPAQTYNPERGGASANDCKPCPAGKFCGIGVSTPENCPKGHYCPVGSSDPRPCPTGTVRDSTGAKSEQDCDPCPAGHYCETPGLSQPTGLCAPGTLCLERATNPAPRDGLTGRICPALGYCEEGATQLQACTPGNFNPYEGGTSSSDCRECFPGAYCNVVDSKPVVGPCEGGYTCPKGSTSATASIAPAGSYAPVGSAIAKPCRPGTHAENEGMTACLPCPAGFYCDEAGMGTNKVYRKDCRKGMYCEEGSIIHKNCPPGTYNPDKNGQTIDDCRACPPGKYCQQEELHEPTGDCAAGYYCAARSISIAPLETDSFGNGPCPAGYYCPEGIEDPVPCPEGTYQPSTRASDRTDCLACKAGWYCENPGLSEPTAQCSPGYFCEDGSTKAEPKGKKCPAGHMCPIGSAFARPCVPGTYQDMEGSTFCNPCPGGYYCPLGAKLSFDKSVICPVGSFCPRGTKDGKEYLCPPGFYNPVQGISSVLNCLPCPPGKYCTTSGLHEPTGECSEGFYCTSGARYPNEVTHECVFESGVLGKGTGTCASREDPFATKPEAEDFCKKSNDCVGIEETESLFYVRCGGVEAPDEGITSIFYPKLCVEAGLCPAGYICPEGTGTPQKCPFGKYCSSMGLADVSGDCAAGFFCDEGAHGKRISVKSVLLASSAHSLAFQPLQGTALVAFSAKQESHHLLMPQIFVPKGTTAPKELQNPFLAAQAHTSRRQVQRLASYVLKGTYGKIEGATSVESCQLCEGGQMCNTPGTGIKGNNAMANCPAGFYCPEGAGSTTPTACTYGEHCPEKSTAPTPCPTGYYCASEALEWPTGRCRGGYVCKVRAVTHSPETATSGAACIENSEGYPCPAGYYCQTGPLVDTFAGSGSAGADGNGGPANEATFTSLSAIAMNLARGELVVADSTGGRISTILLSTGILTDVKTGLGAIGGIAVSNDGNTLYISQSDSGTIVAFNLNEKTQSNVVTGLVTPSGLCLSLDGETLYVAEAGAGLVKAIDLDTKGITSAVGNGATANIELNNPRAVALSLDGEIYVADTGNFRILRAHDDEVEVVQILPPLVRTMKESELEYTLGEITSLAYGRLAQLSIGFACQGQGQPEVTGRCSDGYYCPEGSTKTNAVACPLGHYCKALESVFTNVAFKGNVELTISGDYVGSGTPDKVTNGDTGLGTGWISKNTSSGGHGLTVDFGDIFFINEITVISGSTEGKNVLSSFSVHYFHSASSTYVELFSVTSNKLSTYSLNFGEVATRKIMLSTTDSQVYLSEIQVSGTSSPGQYCGTRGLQDPTGNCLAGYYCKGGAWSPAPHPDEKNPDGISGSAGSLCPIGYYCPAGTDSPKACLEGTSSSIPGGKEQQDCLSCQPGQYCSSTMGTGLCAEGYYCAGGSTTPTPTDNVTGNVCPAGHFCPEGSYVAQRLSAQQVTHVVKAQSSLYLVRREHLPLAKAAHLASFALVGLCATMSGWLVPLQYALVASFAPGELVRICYPYMYLARTAMTTGFVPLVTIAPLVPRHRHLVLVEPSRMELGH
ncbi:Cast multi-domain protein, related [Eimeria brunetti]|uniref:Cast multi-domain protein, related n=1 Tax=Eimeria brunetti TaxID=51314 RepID=U6LNB0_9EIME|nr:Cast multi-domain protein, related [Eimeria brunetti]